MSARIFLKHAQLKGQAKANAFKDAVVINDLTFGISNFIDFSSGNTGNGNVHAHNISCSKKVDGASATLARICAQRMTMTSLVITVTLSPSENSGDLYEFIVYTLTDAVVTEWAQSVVSGDTTESISLHFAGIHMAVKPQGASGSDDASDTFQYNVQTQVATSS